MLQPLNLTRYGLLAVSTLALAGAANAQSGRWNNEIDPNMREGFFFEPYIGLDYQATDVEFDDTDGIDYNDVYEDNFHGGEIRLGARVHKYFSIEGTYAKSAEQEQSVVAAQDLGIDGETRVETQSWGGDVIGHLPVARNIDLLGSIGYARYKANVDYAIEGGALATEAQGDVAENGMRYGLGAEMGLSKNLGLRIMAKYADVDLGDTVDNLYTYNVGLSYHF